MKAKHLQIPEPCTVPWERMSQVESGRYCDSCRKVVRDLANMSDTQLHYVIQHSNGDLCGHIRKDQLNRPLNIHEFKNGPDLLAVVLGLTLLMSTYSAQAEDSKMFSAPISLIEEIEKDSTETSVNDAFIKIRFQVLDNETGEPLPFANVRLKNSQGETIGGAQSDFDGFALLRLTPDLYNATDSVQFECIGYSDSVCAMNEDWKKHEVNEIRLNEIYMDIYEVGGISTSPAVSRKNHRKYKREQRRERRKERKED
ncbi:MAG: carboxypeptidase-like regulatory domain-containing protein [bacterium]|nr:carboxypeptidase-like regulatory domain-containing protein [bacterium]